MTDLCKYCTECTRTLVQAEQDAFFKWARRFDDEVPERRYGVVNPSANAPLTEKDMLYSSCVRKLHAMHWDNWPPHALRQSLDTIEKLEGKMHKNHSSFWGR